MSSSKVITWSGIGIRLMFAALLVFLTYNPTTYSYFHVVKSALGKPGGYEISVYHIFFGIVLLIGWAFFARATIRSLGLIGFMLGVAFFVSLFWIFYRWDWFTLGADAIKWMVLIGLTGILTVGISMSLIRRKITGQIDVDEGEQDKL